MTKNKPGKHRHRSLIIIRAAVLTVVSAVISSVSHAAWDGVVTGTIKRVDVVALNGDNAGFRVVLNDNPALCGNEYVWAYVNKSDDNYQTTVSVLLSAMMAGRTVSIYSNRNTDWSDYCHIGYVVVR